MKAHMPQPGPESLPHPIHLTGNEPPESVERSRELVGPAMREALGKVHPWPGGMAAYMFGWSGETAATARSWAGKGVRPALAVLSAEAAGGSAASAVPGAVAVEFVHAFTLVHDDIMDGDERRRHGETLWKAYGVGPAVLAGDALLAEGVGILARLGGPATEAVGWLARALVDLVHGQSEDIRFEVRPWTGSGAVTEAEYSAMAADKTGSLLGCAAAVGCVLGGGSQALAGALWDMGRHLGLAFQAVDDLLGIWGDPALTGKPAFSDLRTGKKTLPVVSALAAGDAQARRLGERLAARPDGDQGLRSLARAIEEQGGRARCEEAAVQHLSAALRILETADLAPAAAGDLAGLASYLVNRTR